MSILNRTLACLAALTLMAPSLHAQTKPDSIRTALASALDRIHLYNPGAAWHVTIHAQLVDEGKPGDSGTIDIYRNTQGALRTVFAFPNFHQTRYTAKDTLIDGDAGDAPAGLENFLHFFNTSEHLAQLHDAKLRTFDIKRSTITLHCIRATNPATDIGPTFCNFPGSPALRYNTIGGSYVTLFEKMTNFEGGDAPTEATVYFQYQPIARLTIDYSPLSAADADIQPSAKAITATDTSDNLNTLLNHNLRDPFIHPGPTLIAPPDNGAALFRLELKDGHIEHIEILAASDPTTVKDVTVRIRKTLATASIPTSHLFVNYPYTLYVLKKNADANATMPDVAGAN